MKYKLIATDYDDTILTKSGTISDYTRKIIAEYRRRGGYFTVSTGRAHASVVDSALPALGIRDNIAAITYQGAVVRQTADGKILRISPLEPSLAADALEECNRRGFYAQLYYADRIVCNHDCDYRRHYALVTGNLAEVVSDLPAYAVSQSEPCAKIITVSEPSALLELQGFFGQRFKDSVTLGRTGEHLLEVYSSEAGKGNGVKFVAQMLGLTRDEVAAFGDSDNDISMIEYAGCGVAVANASPLLLAAAKHTTASCDEDGVARFIEREVLEWR